VANDSFKYDQFYNIDTGNIVTVPHAHIRKSTIDKLNEAIEITRTVDNSMDFYLISMNNVERKI